MGRTQQTPRTGKRKAKQKRKDAEAKEKDPQPGESEGVDSSEASQGTSTPAEQPGSQTKPIETAETGTEPLKCEESSEECGEGVSTRERKSRKRKGKGGASVAKGEGDEESEARTSPKKGKMEKSKEQEPVTQEEEGLGEGTGEEKDDDEAPEDVPLAESKKEAVEKMKDESEQVQRVRDEARQWRRQKDEQFKVQKEDRKMRELVKFPPESLKKVARKTIEEKKSIKRVQKGKVGRKKAPTQPKKLTESQVGHIKVVALSESPQQSVAPSYEAARSFLTEQLYGRNKRIPALSLSARTYTSRPAINFTGR